MKNTKIYKKHYDYQKFDTNIPEYVEYIVKINRQRKEVATNIVKDFINFAYAYDDRKITWQLFYNYLYDEEYTLSDIKDYYNQLKDILIEHNKYLDSPQYVTHVIDKKLMEGRIKDKKSWENAEHMVDVFGATTIENDNGKKYVLTNARVKEKK